MEMTVSRTTEKSEAVAIVGIGCRYAGARGPRQLWRLLCDGVDAVGTVPADRPALVGLEASRAPGRFGGFVDGVEEFDASFFGISPREAEKMDPQKRILLETVWEAFEDAGIAPRSLVGSNTGVFVGAQATDFWDLVRDEEGDLNTLVGSQLRSVLSGRISYFFDLRGPSLSIDAACAASLAAVHLAAECVRGGQSAVCVAAGSNLLLVPDQASAYGGAGALAADGRCKFGDARADGFTRSDGFGVLVLKRLADARTDGDRVYGVILGGAIGHDGRSSGDAMRPAVEGQAQVLRSAYAAAGVDPARVDYVEAHGTGTTVGDRAELLALGEVVGTAGRRRRPLLVGSLKSNVGHAEGAAGIGGMIKAALCLYEGTIPPSLHMQEPNPGVPWDELRLSVPTQTVSLPQSKTPRLAGVSAFGISGVNTHVVLSGPPAHEVKETPSPLGGPVWLLPLSAHTPEALEALATSYLEFLDPGGEGRRLSMGELCGNAALRRDPLPWRLAVTGADHDELLAGLRAATASSDTSAGGTVGPREVAARRLVFVYSGHGSQWVGMARELLSESPVFAQTLAQCDQAIVEECGWSVLDLLKGDNPEHYRGVEWVHPALFAVQTALHALWRSWGVVPDVVLGHSLGEVGAAYAAQALSLQDATKIICRRAEILNRRGGNGAMAWVELSQEQAKEELRGLEDKLGVAVVNGPSSVVLSGEPGALDELCGRLGEQGVFCRPLNIDIAAHSPQLDDGASGQLIEALESVQPSAAQIPMHSTVLNTRVDGAQLDVGYWARNLRETVLFGPAVRSLLDEGPTSFVEITPHPVVLPAIEAACGEADLAVTSLRRDEPQYQSMLRALGELWSAGHEVDWCGVLGGRPRHAQLPGYPWQPQQFPLPSAPARASSDVGNRPLLSGWNSRREENKHIWEGPLDLRTHAWLLDHRVRGASVFPGAGYVELLASVLGRVHAERSVTLADIAFLRPLNLDAAASPQLQVVLSAGTQRDAWCFEVSSRPASGEAWTTHATGNAVLDAPTPAEEAAGDVGDATTADEFYRHWEARGNQWVGHFRAVTTLRRREGEAAGSVTLPESLAHTGFGFPPPLLDACLQIAVAALPQHRPDVAGSSGGPVLASGIGRIQLHQHLGAQARCRAVVRMSSTNDAEADLWVTDHQDRPLITLTGMRIHLPADQQSASVAAPKAVAAPDDAAHGPLVESLYEVRWQTAPAAAPRPLGRPLLLLDEGSVGTELATCLPRGGRQPILVTRGAEFRQIGDSHWQIDPARAEDYTRLLGSLGADEPAMDIVHLWSLDADTLEQAEDYCLRTTGALVRALSTLDSPAPSVSFVTRGAQAAGDTGCAHPEQALLWGLARVLRNERPHLNLRLIDLDPGDDASASAGHLAHALTRGPAETEFASREGRLLVPRLLPHRGHREAVPEMRRQPVASPESLPAPGPQEVTIRTLYSGVNFHDVLVANEALPDDDHSTHSLGGECSGTVTAVGARVRDLRVGDQVVALAESAFALYLNTDARLACRLPAGLGPAEAGTLPTAYVTAYHALHTMAHLKPGESVLIHAATGGVGMAALRVAAWRGARVFATAGSTHKRSLLRYLGAEYVGDSRSSAFAQEIRSATGGHGVDVILNTTLSGPQADTHTKLLAPYGRLIDLTKSDILADHAMGLRPFDYGLTYASLDLLQLQRDRPKKAGRALRRVVRLAEQGVFPPLPYQTFPASKLEAAFTLMARGGHQGKLLIDYTTTPPPDATQQEADEERVRPDAGYLITGGLGALGLTVAQWLLDAGARHLLLTGRSPLASDAGSADGKRFHALRRLQAQGHVTYIPADAADPQAMGEALRTWRDEGGPAIRGAVHTAGVLEAREIADLTPEHAGAVLRPKAQGAHVLAQVLGKDELDFLWLFSAGSALLGLPYLGAYAAANAYLDALAHRLRADGVPATSINWGYWSTIGMAARKESELGHSLVPDGMRSFTPQEGTSVLHHLLHNPATHLAVLPTDWNRWRQAAPHAAASSLLLTLASATSAGVDLPHKNPIMPEDQPVPENRPQNEDQPGPEAPDPRPAPPPTPQPAPADPPRAASEPAHSSPPAPENASGDLLELLRQQVADILGTAPEQIQAERPLNEQGLSSLLAMELRVRIEKRLGITIPTAELFTATPTTLAGTLTHVSADQ
ncbi:acyltransferase domain-containing protein [Streptomyces buecherae]|uniref:acyltransferase domain-containing protein n=1 Tax=Streptomyces buecherae TaxID=2763006 RepID=UPI00367E841B